MKIIYTTVIVIVLSFAGHAQIVNIPDINFKNRLLSRGVDFNNNGEIDTFEALAFNVVDVSSMSVPGPFITDLTGIEAFTNLTELNCDNNQLTSLHLSTLTNLQKLSFKNNHLQTIDFNGLSALTDLECDNNPLPALDLSLLSNLQKLTCTGNQMSNIDLSPATALAYLDCHSNQLPELNLSANANLKTVISNDNVLTSINFGNINNLEFLNCGYNSLAAIDFGNLNSLKTIYCNHNSLTALNLGNLVNLEQLECSNNLLTSLEANTLTHLTELSCGFNQIASLDVTGMNSLNKLYCNDNGMTNLNVSEVGAITNLNCSANQLTSLNIANLTNLSTLSASSNLLTTIEFTSTPLRSVSLSNNLFTTLDFTPIACPSCSSSYILTNNPNLTYVNVKNGAHFHNTQGPSSHSSFDAANCPSLQFICADEYNFYYIASSAPNALLSPYCSFTPGGTYNNISGTISLDIDNNGCDANDLHLSNNRLNISNTSLNGATFTNSSGNYYFYTQTGDFVLTPVFENPYFTVSPLSATISFANSNSNTQTQNFCVLPDGVHNDVEITLIPLTVPRAGFNADYKLVYKNKGNQPLSGAITLGFDDAVLDLVSSNPAVGAQSLNTLEWNYASLLPFESRGIAFTLNTNSPQEIPPLNGGDVINFTASITPVAGDETIRDNTLTFAQTVVNSFDPNDKSCLEGDTIAPEKVGDYLHYIIHFENSGNSVAENIVVKDVIDADKYDISSLQLVSSSHPHQTKITGNNVEFIFEGINLPPGIEGEEASRGYVAFKIKTKSSLAPGNSVSNTAGIYFDYNFPVTTNTATTTVSTLAKNAVEDKSVSILPNPVKDKLYIMAKQNITSVQLFDIQGRLVETTVASGKDAVLNLAKNARGVYFVKIYTEKGVKVEKIIKE